MKKIILSFALMLTWCASDAAITTGSPVTANTLNGATFAAPGPIGSGTASTGAFSTLSASQGLTLPTVENALTAAAGGTQAGCLALSATATFHRITTVASSADSICLPASAVGAMHYIRNDASSGNAIMVFGTSPDTINGIATATGVSMSVNQGAWFICTGSGAWTSTGPLLFTGTGVVGVRQTSPTIITPTLSGATSAGIINGSGKISTALNGNSTQIQIAVRNTDATSSGAGQTRIDWGNDGGASAGTIGLNASTHATQPNWFEVINQTSGPTLLGSNGTDIAGVSSAGIINAVNSNRLLMGMAAPTISSGFGTSPTIVSSNGATTFRLNVGTGGTANGGVIGLPTAATGWNCNIDILNPSSTNLLSKTVTTATTTASLTVSNELLSTGSATAWPASTILILNCFSY